MKLYDEIISHWEALCKECPGRVLEIRKPNWKDAGNSNMVLRSNMAYELGGSDEKHFALGGTAVTDHIALVPRDEIILIGPDLCEISEDCNYARLSIARVDGEAMGDGNALYNAIRKIEYVRYHVNPEGFMMRVSASRARECVRVSKDAVANGLSFERVGNIMLEQFHANAKVQAVKIVFITDENFDYVALAEEINQSEQITKAIDHIMKNVIMDCQSCSLQEICDEVEGMKELHFGVNAEASFGGSVD